MLGHAGEVEPEPRASVIMACRNHAQFLDEAMTSVLVDAPSDVEVLVVNDGSVDGTGEMLERFASSDPRITLIENEAPRGLAYCLNLCARRARGQYLIRMDADDVVLPGRIRSQLDFLERNPDIGVVGGWADLIDTRGEIRSTRIYPERDADIKRIMLRVSPFAHPATAIRKSCFESVGGYNARLLYAQDLDLWFRLGKVTNFANLQKSVIRYRVHQHSTTVNFVRDIIQRSIKLRLHAVLRQGYRPTLLDLLFIVSHAATLPFPVGLRTSLFEWVRSWIVRVHTARK